MKHTKKLARGYVNRFSRAAKLIDTMAKHVRHMNDVDFAELNEHFITAERRRNYGHFVRPHKIKKVSA